MTWIVLLLIALLGHPSWMVRDASMRTLRVLSDCGMVDPALDEPWAGLTDREQYHRWQWATRRGRIFLPMDLWSDQALRLREDLVRLGYQLVGTVHLDGEERGKMVWIMARKSNQSTSAGGGQQPSRLR